MSRRFGFAVGFTLCVALSAAAADERRDQGMQAYAAGDYAGAYAKWSVGAMMGDSEQQELVANLLLGPHGRAIKHAPYAGTRFLYLAAIGGRRSAMSTLATAIDKGASGFRKVPAAARCWAAAPSTIERKTVCVGLTAFDDRRARAPCHALPFVPDKGRSNRDSGSAKARLCLANGTPALLVPGPPPSLQDEMRVREYARNGIEWNITGDVVEEDFEQFRNGFNATTAAAIEQERGRGYLEKLSRDIERRLSRGAR